MVGQKYPQKVTGQREALLGFQVATQQYQYTAD